MEPAHIKKQKGEILFSMYWIGNNKNLGWYGKKNKKKKKKIKSLGIWLVFFCMMVCSTNGNVTV
jgi:hypothetical protein